MDADPGAPEAENNYEAIDPEAENNYEVIDPEAENNDECVDPGTPEAENFIEDVVPGTSEPENNIEDADPGTPEADKNNDISEYGTESLEIQGIHGLIAESKVDEPRPKLERVDTDETTSIDTNIPTDDELIINPRKMMQSQISTLSSSCPGEQRFIA